VAKQIRTTAYNWLWG